ncbi:uncharacterized protein LOC100846643 isoform X2 [Brachypodium distachyon]|uniref:uncharacterized protein LOC100846643 isoform X2 n=1 Tax=Brachypodium distachyon TaxID=15368 RepID=UPI00071C8FA1|nr:uncharacterized protein LOC100846643 isoform X2 [Brachypodium distachyon]|eukprot:XP_014758047.1 uncharacterized protein LOC100846643 isoform X2 [Brachypodium distachyon]
MRFGSSTEKDIWHHILSIVPMKDAARAACVCHAFLRSWRCHPNLTFTKKTMCLKELRKGTAGLNDIKEYAANIDHVLTKHSGVGVKIFKIDYRGPYDDKTYNRLNNWLQIAVTPWIEELDLNIQRPRKTVNFNFPCALLSERCRDSIRRLHLANCNLHSAFEPGLTSLTVLRLYNVHITGDELGCLLSDSLALEELMLIYCNDIRRLEIPCVLQRFRNLLVVECLSLRVIENKAPNISRFDFSLIGKQVQLLFGESLQVKMLSLAHSSAISSFDMIPSSLPYLENLSIHSGSEMANAPIVSSRFLHLKFLRVCFSGCNFHQDYDYLSLVSFLDAFPSLETFVLFVSQQSKYDSIDEHTSSLRKIPEHCHGKLKRVKITGFSPRKSMVELACHILENTPSLECLTLDTTSVSYRCFGDISRICAPLIPACIREARKTVLAVKTYIAGKVPSTVKLNVLEPCSRCHAL